MLHTTGYQLSLPATPTPKTRKDRYQRRNRVRMTSPGAVRCGLQPPYPLSHLEEQTLASGAWTLVQDSATSRVLFFNPSTRVATRSLLSTLLASPNATVCAPTGPPPPAEETTATLAASLAAARNEIETLTQRNLRLESELQALRYIIVSGKKLVPATISSGGNSNFITNPLSHEETQVLYGSPLRSLNVSSPVSEASKLPQRLTSAEEAARLVSERNSNATPMRQAEAILRQCSASKSPLDAFDVLPAHTPPARQPAATSATSDQQKIAELTRRLEDLTTLNFKLMAQLQRDRGMTELGRGVVHGRW